MFYNTKNRLTAYFDKNNKYINNNSKINSLVREVRGVRNEISILATTINKSSIIINGDNNKIFLENSLIGNTNIRINGNDHILSLKKSEILSGEILFIDNGNKIIIDEHTTIGINIEISIAETNSKITIGKECMLSNNIIIRNSDFHSIINAGNGERINYAQDVEIGNHVWIASNAYICKGVIINDNSVIGVGSIVTSNISGDCVAAGNPARIVKQGCTWDRARI